MPALPLRCLCAPHKSHFSPARMAYSYEALFEDLTGATGYSVLDVQLAADTTRETVTELQILA